MQKPLGHYSDLVRVFDIGRVGRSFGVSQERGHGLGRGQMLGRVEGRQRFQARIDAAGQRESLLAILKDAVQQFRQVLRVAYRPDSLIQARVSASRMATRASSLQSTAMLM